MRRHPREEDLLLHCREPEAPIASHLASCPACAARAAELRSFLDELARAEAPVPERGEGYGRELYLRIAPRLAPRRRLADLLAALAAPRRLALAGGVLALLVLGFLAGRLWPSAPGIPAAARERILLVAVGAHLDRSQLVLLELLNSDDPAAAGAARAEELVSDSRLYRQAALRTGDRAVAGLLDDLERLLLDVAHAPGPYSAEERDALRRRIQKSGLLFKVRILGARLEAAERPAPPRA